MTLTVSAFPQALQEKVESLQRQLRTSEKELLSKELETEEKVMQSLFLPISPFSMLVRHVQERQAASHLNSFTLHRYCCITPAAHQEVFFFQPTALRVSHFFLVLTASVCLLTGQIISDSSASSHDGS